MHSFTGILLTITVKWLNLNNAFIKDSIINFKWSDTATAAKNNKLLSTAVPPGSHWFLHGGWDHSVM